MVATKEYNRHSDRHKKRAYFRWSLSSPNNFLLFRVPSLSILYSDKAVSAMILTVGDAHKQVFALPHVFRVRCTDGHDCAVAKVVIASYVYHMQCSVSLPQRVSIRSNDFRTWCFNWWFVTVSMSVSCFDYLKSFWWTPQFSDDPPCRNYSNKLFRSASVLPYPLLLKISDPGSTEIPSCRLSECRSYILCTVSNSQDR